MGEAALPAPTRARPALAALVIASGALFALRVVAASRIGFGDSEALYASYALHPQPAYLDHPGLVGALARLIGGGTAPSALRAHLVTAALATGFPWLLALACRACGANPRRALLVALVAALTPEIAVGLLALTPDLLLAYAWTGSLALAAQGLGALPRSGRAAACFAGAGVLAGVAAASKVTGVCLAVALVAAYASRRARPRGGSLAPWAGLAAGALVVAPVLAFEAATGWPIVRHRLVDTQVDAGLSLRNLGAVLGGQLLYLSPLVLVLVFLAARAVAAEGPRDAVGQLLFAAVVVPMAALVPLCLWSRVAEPHWLAPPLLALAMAAARSRLVVSRRLFGASCALAGAMVVAVHAWVLVPGAVRLAPGSYDARLDISNELYGWPDAAAAVREEAAGSWSPGMEPGDLVVAGPHWVICAQLDAALRGSLPVGCDTPVRDDFDDWLPRARWRRADVVIWVDDGRFGPPALPAYVPYRTRRTTVVRGGHTVRTFTITVLARRAAA
ncbi:MAG: glycosyltransferase family 39 protein [Polyangiaceae bacterium]